MRTRAISNSAKNGAVFNRAMLSCIKATVWSNTIGDVWPPSSSVPGLTSRAAKYTSCALRRKPREPFGGACSSHPRRCVLRQVKPAPCSGALQRQFGPPPRWNDVPHKTSPVESSLFGHGDARHRTATESPRAYGYRLRRYTLKCTEKLEIFLEQKLMKAEVAIVGCKEDALECGPLTRKDVLRVQSCACRRCQNRTLAGVRRNCRRRRRGVYTNASHRMAVRRGCRFFWAARMRRRTGHGHRGASPDWTQKKEGHREDCQAESCSGVHGVLR